MSEGYSGEEKGLPVTERVREASLVLENYLNIRQEPERADAIFILGGSSTAPIEKAVELYRSGFAPKIAFISIGGRFGGEKVWGMPEHEKYKKVLLEKGIPDKDILSEGKTGNTLAEAQEALPFLLSQGVDAKKLILVSRPLHQRRAFATFSIQHPEVKYINCPADEKLDMMDTNVRQRLVQEAERLLDYATQGDLEKQEIPPEVLKAAVIVRMELKQSGSYTHRQKPDRGKT